jgi:hypothetical protein
MGYDLHITRKRNWTDDGDEISFDEFVALVKGDSEFIYPGLGGPDYADWTSPSTGYKSWLHWDENGYIQTKNPEPQFIDKMVSLSKHLDARVQGDDGEIYLSSVEILPAAAPIDDSPVVAPSSIDRRIGYFIVGAVIISCLVIYLKLK